MVVVLWVAWVMVAVMGRRTEEVTVKWMEALMVRWTGVVVARWMGVEMERLRAAVPLKQEARVAPPPGPTVAAAEGVVWLILPKARRAD